MSHEYSSVLNSEQLTQARICPRRARESLTAALRCPGVTGSRPGAARLSKGYVFLL